MATRTSREEWELRVKRWVRSGLSADDFAAGEPLSAQALVWWRAKLRRGGADEPGDAAPAFVRIGAASEPLAGAMLFEVALANGRVVRVPGAFDDGVLARVLAVAEAR